MQGKVVNDKHRNKTKENKSNSNGGAENEKCEPCSN